MTSDDQKNISPQPSQPFQGSDQIIKNLHSYPSGSGDSEDLLSVVTDSDTSAPESPGADNESK